MSDMWVDLLPVLFAMMISPARTLAVILLLHTPRSTATALSYVLGMISAMMEQGAALGASMSIIGLTAADRSGDLTVLAGALFVAGGVILLAGAFKLATAPVGGGGTLASALERLERLGPSGAYKVGFGWIFASPKQWVFVLTAVAVIFTAQLSTVGSLANYLIFTLFVQLAYFVIIGAYVLARDRVSRVLDAAFEWIKAHLRATAIGSSQRSGSYSSSRDLRPSLVKGCASGAVGPQRPVTSSHTDVAAGPMAAPGRCSLAS